MKKEEKDNQILEEMPEKKKKLSKWVIVLIVLGCLYYIVPIGLFCFAIITDNFTTEYKVLNDGSIEIDKGKLIIQKDVKGYYNEEKAAYYIEGKLTNNYEKDYNNIEISYYLYNAEGEVLGEATAYIQKLGSKKTWSFKVIYDEVDAKNVSSFEYKANY